jgi:hypothetical protein
MEIGQNSVMYVLEQCLNAYAVANRYKSSEKVVVKTSETSTLRGMFNKHDVSNISIGVRVNIRSVMGFHAVFFGGIRIKNRPV